MLVGNRCLRCTRYELAAASLATVLLLATILDVRSARASEATAHHWLAKMADAVQTLNYDGTFVYRNGDQIESMRIIHRASPGGERERMFSLTGAAREVLRDKEKVTCIFPDNQSVVVAKSRPRSVTPRIFDPKDDFAKFYRLSTHPGDRVAGRETAMVLVAPADDYRYGYRLWLDKVTGLMLKSELVSADGISLEQIVYTNLRLPAHIPDHLLEPAASGEGYTWYSNDAPLKQAGAQSDGRWTIGWVPDGFRMSDHAFDPSSVSSRSVEHVVYSDGLASMSVFIEHLDGAKERLEGHSSMGAINAYGSVVGDFQITVVGEVPDITVERVAKSVARQ